MVGRITLVVFLFISSLVNAKSSAEIYFDEEGLDATVAQLFIVGIPTDYNNSSTSSDFAELIDEIKVGGVMLNGYNLPKSELIKHTKQLAFNKVTSLTKSIKLSGSSPLIAVDFESYKYTSIKYPLSLPPEPLVLAATGDTKYSYYAGQMAGKQLSQIGVNIILGPVVDMDNSKQGYQSKSLSMRSFSDAKHILGPHASAYAKGLKDAGLITIGKHFPSYGYVSGKDAHKEAIETDVSLTTLEEELDMFSLLENNLNGIMTSHLIVKQSDRSKPVTFNKDFIDQQVKSDLKLKTKLLITDDLSNMDAAKEYFRKINSTFNYQQLALEAFKAGHDMLLFSHISGHKTNKHSQFNTSELRKSISAISSYIKSNPKYRKQLLDSVNKVLSIKEASRIDTMSVKLDLKGLDIFERENDFTDYQSYLRTTFDKAVTLISEGYGRDLGDINSSTKVLFIAPKQAIQVYKHALNGSYNSSFYELSSSYRTPSLFEKEKKKILKQVESFDRVYMVIESKDHRNLLDHIRLKSSKLLDKMTIFVHASPYIINSPLFNTVKILGNFSIHPQSYLSDIKVLKREIVANTIKSSPMSLNDGGVFKTINAPAPRPHNNSNKIRFFATDLEEKQHDEIAEKNKKIEQLEKQGKSLNLYTLLIYFIAILLLVTAFFLSMVKHSSTNFCFRQYVKSFLKRSNYSTPTVLIIISIVFCSTMISSAIFPKSKVAILIHDTFLEYVPVLKPLSLYKPVIASS